MKRPLFEQDEARKAKTWFRMLQHAQKISHNVSQTCRFFGISRAQYYIGSAASRRTAWKACGTGPAGLP